MLEADEIKQIDSDPRQDDDLDEELDDVDVEDEEDEELEEEERVETVAKANRGS